MTGNDVNSKASDAARKAKALSPSVQYAITRVLPNILNGAFWGFTDMAGVKDHIDDIKNSGGKITARQLGNACLLEVDPNFLLTAVVQIDANAVKQKDLETMKQARAEAEIQFEKFLIQKGKKLGKDNKPFSGMIGIYCTNDVSTISYKNVQYPAFRVNMQTALGLLGRYGYTVKVGGAYVSAQQASMSGQNLWSSVSLSPTKTGLFIEITSTLPVEQVKTLEQQFKQRYDIK